MDPNKMRLSRIAQHQRVRFHGDPDDPNYPHGDGGSGHDPDKTTHESGALGAMTNKELKERQRALGLKHRGMKPGTPESKAVVDELNRIAAEQVRRRSKG